MKNTDTPSLERLKTCPFCEHEDELLVLSKGAGGETWHEVYCDHCCASGPANPTRAEAIAGWNTRATLETLTPSAGEGVEREAAYHNACGGDLHPGEAASCGPLAWLMSAIDMLEEESVRDAALASDDADPDAYWEMVSEVKALHARLAAAFALTPSPPLEQPDIEGRHCNRCAEDLAPTQMLCPFCDSPSVPISEALSLPDITRELLASKRPYAVFDYYSDVDGVPDQQNFMVSTLSIPQHPVALCGPDRKFADALCAMLNSLSLPTTEIRRHGWLPIETAPKDGSHILVCRFAGCALDWAREAWWKDGPGSMWAMRGGCCDPTHWTPMLPLFASDEAASPPSRPSFDKWDYAAAALADARCAK